MICSCCDWWSQSAVVNRGGSAHTRLCIAKHIKIQADSKSCKYFNPTYFHCDQFGQRISFTQCLARRRNEKNFDAWDACKNCRQFEKEIKEVVMNYFLEAVPIATPRRLRKKKQTDSGSTRKIKRRNKEENPKRTIKRRTKVVKESSKPKRKIKRRK